MQPHTVLRSFPWLVTLRVAIVLTAIIGPVVYGSSQLKHTRNFQVVQEHVLYRSGQVTLPGLQRLVHDHGIRTVVCLREGDTQLEQDEEAWCRREDVKYVRIRPRNWWDDANNAPGLVQDGIEAFLDVMDDPDNYPVLVHCFAGTHRSGAYVAVYRMEYEGWSNADAMAELKAQGYPHLESDLDISTYLRNYKPRRR